ncbi:MAG: PTS transporter subunit EIIC [Schwartzia sp. (in: firmicutes)]
MNPQEIARAVAEILGEENMKSPTHCMTRLRLRVKAPDERKENALKKIPGVLGINRAGEELQIVLGPGRAAAVAEALRTLLSQASTHAATASPAACVSPPPTIGDGETLRETLRARNATPVKLFFKRVTNIFLPLIPAFIACGLLTGLLNIFLRFFPAAAGSSLVQLLYIAGNTAFYGLNLLVGWNTAKEAGGSPALGAILAALISHPQLAAVTLFDAPLVPGRGGVISVLFIAGAGAYLEKRLHRLVPEILDLFLTPLLVLLIAGTAAILLLQPIGGFLSEGISRLTAAAIEEGGAVTGGLLGGSWLPIVMLGLHHAMTPIHAELLAQEGVTALLPVLAMAGAGQVGAALAVYVKTKNAFLKKTILSALPVGMMGIGEPLIYGVTFPLFRPFVGACIGGACGGAVVAFFAVGAGTLGISGLPLAAATNQPLHYLWGVLTAYLVGFIAAYLLGFIDPAEESAPQERKETAP